MNELDTIQIGPNQVWHVLTELSEQQRAAAGIETEEPGRASSPSVPDIARKHNLKVGNKEVRQVGKGELPAPGQQVEVNGWLVMRATDYPRIVPQEALDPVEILLDEGVEIKGLLVADDLRNHRPGALQRAAARAIERVRAIEWQKHRATIKKCLSVLASVLAAGAVALGTRMKDKVEEIDWGEVRSVFWSGVKVVAIVAACVAVAAFALPLLAIAAVPAAVVTLDPWLIVVDSENRWWVVAEWWD